MMRLRSSPTPKGRCWLVEPELAGQVAQVAILADPERPVLALNAQMTETAVAIQL